jgi:hypothetical protein
MFMLPQQEEAGEYKSIIMKGVDGEVSAIWEKQSGIGILYLRIYIYKTSNMIFARTNTKRPRKVVPRKKT